MYNWGCATSPSAPMTNSPIAAIHTTEHGRMTYTGTAIKVFECTQAGEKVSELVEVDSLGVVCIELQRIITAVLSVLQQSWLTSQHSMRSTA